MLKEKITSLDEVPEGTREHYGPAEDGNGFELQIDGAGPLRNALRHERQHRKNAENRSRELDEQVRMLKGLPKPEEMTPRQKFFAEAARRCAGLEGEAKAAELAKLEQEMAPILEAELTERRKAQEQKIEAQRRTIGRLMREGAATDLVMRIRRPGTEPHVLQALVLERFEVKEEAGEFSVIAKGANGRPVSLDALAEELRATPALAPLVAGASEAEKAAHARKVSETLGQARPNGAAR